MKRTPLKRGNSQLKRSPLRQRGKGASAWTKFTREYPAPDWPCAKCSREGRSTVAQVWHHRGQRSTHPEYVTDMANLVALCSRCHDLVHTNNIDSFRMGWILRSWVVPGSDEDPFTK